MKNKRLLNSVDKQTKTTIACMHTHDVLMYVCAQSRRKYIFENMPNCDTDLVVVHYRLTFKMKNLFIIQLFLSIISRSSAFRMC